MPASKLAAALNYVRNHWEALNTYVVDGALLSLGALKGFFRTLRDSCDAKEAVFE